MKGSNWKPKLTASSATPFHLAAQPASAKIGGGRRCGWAAATCGLSDFIGGVLIWLDLGRWLEDVEKHKALAVYSPHEGGYEGRYLNRLRYQGYRFLDLTARGLGDPETTLTKIHPVCPVRLSQLSLSPTIDHQFVCYWSS